MGLFVAREVFHVTLTCGGNTIILNSLALGTDFAWRRDLFCSSIRFCGQKKPDNLGFDEAIAIVADVYWRALEVATALVLGGR